MAEPTPTTSAIVVASMPRLVAHSGSSVLRLERIALTAVAANPTRSSTRRDSRIVVSSFGRGASAGGAGIVDDRVRVWDQQDHHDGDQDRCHAHAEPCTHRAGDSDRGGARNGPTRKPSRCAPIMRENARARKLGAMTIVISACRARPNTALETPISSAHTASGSGRVDSAQPTRASDIESGRGEHGVSLAEPVHDPSAGHVAEELPHQDQRGDEAGEGQRCAQIMSVDGDDREDCAVGDRLECGRQHHARGDSAPVAVCAHHGFLVIWSPVTRADRAASLWLRWQSHRSNSFAT